MANFDTSEFRDPPVAFPTSGVHMIRGRYVNGSTVITSADKLRLTYLPKGAAIVPELCKVFSDDVDPSAGAALAGLFVTNDTITKTVITAVAFADINTLITPLAPAVTALNFFKTSSDDFYAYIAPTAAANLAASAEIFWQIGYTMDTGRAESTT
jgi:hypothetical protein